MSPKPPFLYPDRVQLHCSLGCTGWMERIPKWEIPHSLCPPQVPLGVTGYYPRGRSPVAWAACVFCNLSKKRRQFSSRYHRQKALHGFVQGEHTRRGAVLQPCPVQETRMQEVSHLFQTLFQENEKMCLCNVLDVSLGSRGGHTVDEHSGLRGRLTDFMQLKTNFHHCITAPELPHPICTSLFLSFLALMYNRKLQAQRLRVTEFSTILCMSGPSPFFILF